ncbi:hypothetical protein OIU76_003798, partial [Salix suchowensis]
MDRNTLSEILKNATSGGASRDQRVTKRKNREHKIWAKKMKMIVKKAEIKQQKAGFCDAQNKIITEQESRVGELLKEPLVQDLL